MTVTMVRVPSLLSLALWGPRRVVASFGAAVPYFGSSWSGSLGRTTDSREDRRPRANDLSNINVGMATGELVDVRCACVAG
jgi:hypothetical protein